MSGPIEQQLQDQFWSWYVEVGCTYFGYDEEVDFESPEEKATHVARMFPQQTHALAKAFEAGVATLGRALGDTLDKAQSEVDDD